MDEQRTDAAGQAVALGEDIIAELRQALTIEGIEAPATPEAPQAPLREPGAQSVAEAVEIARKTLADYEAVLDDQRRQVAAWLERKNAERASTVEERIAQIKAGLK